MQHELILEFKTQIESVFLLLLLLPFLNVLIRTPIYPAPSHPTHTQTDKMIDALHTADTKYCTKGIRLQREELSINIGNMDLIYSVLH